MLLLMTNPCSKAYIWLKKQNNKNNTPPNRLHSILFLFQIKRHLQSLVKSR